MSPGATRSIRRSFSKERPPHVCIVGGGVSGLRCADVLLQRGFEVTILEGRNRLGGRLHQEIHNGALVDMGPNWIHGTKENPICDLAKETGTVTCDFDADDMIFDGDGSILSESERKKHFDIMWQLIEEANDYSNQNCASIPASNNLREHFREKLIERFPGDDQRAQRSRDLVLKMCELWGCWIGTQVEHQSLKHFWMEENIEGETPFVAETYRKILNHLTDNVTSKGVRLRFGAVVKSIKSTTDPAKKRVTVKRTLNQSADRNIYDTTRCQTEERRSEQRDETMYEDLDFDEVIVTAPLGWLKRNMDSFDPPLPPRMRKGIQMLGYGNLEKVYIFFDNAWWNQSNSSSDVNSDGSIRTGAESDSSGEDGAQEDQKECTQTFYMFLEPEYAPTQNPKRWLQQSVNLSQLPGSCAHPTLLFYICGDNSLYITSKLKELSGEDAKKFLLDFFQPYLSRLPNYRRGGQCEPKDVVATSWTNDDLAGNGSYTNFQVGLEEGDRDVDAIREGCPERGLWFAGEHTAPYVALGTVTGAYWSGEAAARRVAEAYRA